MLFQNSFKNIIDKKENIGLCVFGQPAPNFDIYKLHILMSNYIFLQQLWMDCQFWNCFIFQMVINYFIACIQHLQSA